MTHRRRVRILFALILLAIVLVSADSSSTSTAAKAKGKGKGKGAGGKAKGTGTSDHAKKAIDGKANAGASSDGKAKPGGTSMSNSKALKDLPRSQIGWSGEGKAMLASQQALAAKQGWTPDQRAYLESVKRSLIGNATMTPTRLNQFDKDAVCKWDCYQRMTMLEPLAAEIFNNNIPGDFVEAHGALERTVPLWQSPRICLE